MEAFVWYLRGYWILEIQGTGLDWFLNSLSQRHIPFWNLCWLDSYTLRLCVFCCDLKEIEQTACKTYSTVKRVTKAGFRNFVSGLLRPVLIAGATVVALLLVVVPQYLLFFEVDGNETMAESAIMRELEAIGIDVGTKGTSIKPKWIKDHVLQKLPQLQWITVTQNGCIGKVVVREREPAPAVIDRRKLANVVATQAGQITGQSILAGQPMKKTGDIVLEGEMLVSGVVDLERVFSIVYAQAEIFARTWKNIDAVTPNQVQIKDTSQESSTSLWLEIGKERIKIFGNSGIYDGVCDKMIRRKTLSLPGGYTLPITLQTETIVPWTTVEAPMDQTTALTMLSDHARLSFLSRTRAGEILRTEWTLSSEWGLFRLSGVMECHELISETVEAEWNEEDFADD